MSDQDRCETAVKLALALVAASRPVMDCYRASRASELVYTCDECGRQVKESQFVFADGRLCAGTP